MVFGDSMYVERLYTFMAMGITAWLTVVLWKAFFKNDDRQKQLTWLPVFIWITIPVTFWSYSNNMMENTMGIFTLSAAIFIFRALEMPYPSIMNWLLGGLFIFLATLSKGLPGFFPLAVPAFYWLFYKRNNVFRALYGTVILAAVSILCYALLWCYPPAKESLSLYFFTRALSRINQLPTVTSHFYILYSLVMELLPQLIIVAIILFIGWRAKIKLLNPNTLGAALFFIAVGLAGTAPLMLTLVQKGFYYVPALPFFAIGLSILIAPTICNLIERINSEGKGFKAFLFITEITLIAVIIFSFMQTGKVSRDSEALHDVYLIGKVVPKFSVVAGPLPLWEDWSLQCYLMRYDNISIDCRKRELNYFMCNKDTNVDSLTNNYLKVDIPTQRYDLYVLMKFKP